MARAAKKASRRKLTLVASNGRNTNRGTDHFHQIQKEQEAQLEYQQNKRRFTTLRPRNENQAIFIDHLNSGRLTFALGPAGTGKTIVSTLWACQELEAERIERIVVTRPMVGCDEDMGFLPGTEDEKYIGWVGPVMEILQGYFGKARVTSLMKYDKITMKPLMMMRGSTFRDSIVILDEAQNTTVNQMKMFLTRLGEGSKVIINGDEEQSDLPKHTVNGLSDAVKRLERSEIIKIVRFEEKDIVRDPLVREILRSYRTT